MLIEASNRYGLCISKCIGYIDHSHEILNRFQAPVNDPESSKISIGAEVRFSTMLHISRLQYIVKYKRIVTEVLCFRKQQWNSSRRSKMILDLLKT